MPDMSPSDFKVALHESVFRVSFVCAVSMALRASRVPVLRTHAFLPARVLAHDLRELLLDVGPDVFRWPVVTEPARGLRGCEGGTPTSKSCEVMSKCRMQCSKMQCNKMASANATPSPESALTRLPLGIWIPALPSVTTGSFGPRPRKRRRMASRPMKALKSATPFAKDVHMSVCRM